MICSLFSKFGRSNINMLTLLISYYDSGQNDVVTNHLASVDVPSVNALSLFDKIKEIFEKCNLLFSKLLVMLMDNCSAMRGELSRHLTLDCFFDVSLTI